MNSHTHDFVTVDMRGLKAALVARAQAERVSVSVLVRAAVTKQLGPMEGDGAAELAAKATYHQSTVKLSIRFTRAEVEQLSTGACSAGLSRAAYLAGLITNVPVLMDGGSSRAECLAALTASSAELATLSRNIHHLTALLRQGSVRAAQEYRQILDTLADDVRGHLKLASSLLVELRPRSREQPDPPKRQPA